MRSCCSEHAVAVVALLRWIVVWNVGERRGLYCPTTKSHQDFYCGIWSTSPPRIQKLLAWLTRGGESKISFPVRTDKPFILKSVRGGEPSAQLRDESLRDGTAVEGWVESCRGAVWPFWWTTEEWDRVGGGRAGQGRAGWLGGASVSQPSIPKSSVNFLTFSRSSVLTVGRVVDRERSMSDCKGSRDFFIFHPV